MSSFSGDDGGRRGSSFDALQFDFASLTSNRGASSRPLRDQKPANPAAAASWTNTPAASAARPSWTHQRAASPSPAWTHQPVSGGLASAPTSMVGDIFGKTWSTPPAVASSSATGSLGIPRSNNPNLFSDLVGSALGSCKGAPMNAPLKSSAPPAATGTKSSFSTSGLSENLPPTAYPSSVSSNAYGNTMNFRSAAGGAAAGRPMRPSGAVPIGQNTDPFASLSGFGMKSAATSNAADNNAFGSFQTANLGGSNNTSGKGPTFTAATQSAASAKDAGADGGAFGVFQGSIPSKFDHFGLNGSSFAPQQSQQPAAKAADTSFDMFFPATSAAPPVSTGNANSVDEWDISSQFAGHDDGNTTTELEGLPPPPAGLTVTAAKTKGMDNYKGGQYADAIKWLSWAVVLIEKTGDDATMAEVLSCRASSYKEVGEYKKAIADCSKILAKDKENVSVLVQRALLYESSEKYRLGAEDLRLVLKIDPGNRVARSTVHRLSKMAD